MLLTMCLMFWSCPQRLAIVDEAARITFGPRTIRHSQVASFRANVLLEYCETRHNRIMLGGIVEKTVVGKHHRETLVAVAR